jgi:hypothetical protein
MEISKIGISGPRLDFILETDIVFLIEINYTINPLRSSLPTKVLKGSHNTGGFSKDGTFLAFWVIPIRTR